MLPLCVPSTKMTAAFYPKWLLSNWGQIEVSGGLTACLPPYKTLASDAACLGGSPHALKQVLSVFNQVSEFPPQEG